MILWGECECDQTFAVKIMNLIAGNQVRLPNFSFQQSQGCCFTRDAKLWHLECVYFFPSCDTSAVCVSFFSTFASSKDLLLLWQMFPFKHNPCSGVGAGVTTAQYQPISPRGSFVQTNPPGKFIFIKIIISWLKVPTLQQLEKVLALARNLAPRWRHSAVWIIRVMVSTHGSVVLLAMF